MAKILIITTDDPRESLIPLFEGMQKLGFSAVLELSWNMAVRRLERGERFGAILSSKHLRYGSGEKLGFDGTLNLLKQARRKFSEIKLAVIAAGFTAGELILLHEERIGSFRLDNSVGIKRFCEYLPEPQPA